GKSPGLQPKTLASADALSGRWSRAHRQQSGREPDSALGIGALELAVCRVAAQRQTGGGDHEPDPVGAHEWARSVRLPEGRPQPAADTAGERDWPIAAASVDTA